MKTRSLISSFLALALVASLVVSAAAAEFRIWTNSSGKAIEARLVERRPDSIVLEMRNAKRYEIPVANLSEKDITWMETQETTAHEAELDSHGIAIEPLMTKPGKIVFEDTLSEIAEGWSAGHGEWTIVEAALNGKELAADDHAATFKRKMSFHDAIIQYSFKLGENASTTFSVNDSEDHVCRVSISASGFSTQKDDHDHEGPDAAVKFQTTDLKIKPGEWHTILIEIKGDTLVAQIDDEVSHGSHELIGKVEKASFGFTLRGESVQFKDFKMWEALPNEEWEQTRKKLERRS